MLGKCCRPYSLDLFESIFNDDLFTFDFKTDTSPTYDIVENDDGFVVDFMLAGFRKEDISADVEENVLTVKGERKVQNETKYNRKGSFYGKFGKSFTLPDNVLADKINASFTDGVLSLEIPKNKESKLSTVIEIK